MHAGDFCQRFQVVELQPDQRVRWKAVGNNSMDEWDGTCITVSSHFKTLPSLSSCR